MGQRYSTKHEARPTICINKVVFSRRVGDMKISTCEESKNSQRMSKPSPYRNDLGGSDISMVSAAVCVGASTIATGD